MLVVLIILTEGALKVKIYDLLVNFEQLFSQKDVLA